MNDYVHEPNPEFPEWLAHAEVVSQLAHLTCRDEQTSALNNTADLSSPTAESVQDWPNLAPRLESREVIASSADAESFGWHLEWKAWTMGASDAPRQAFVANGQAVNWTIHKCHFSQMTGKLDLMHALSYARRAAEALDDHNAYRRHATWIWQGRVERVIDKLCQHQQRLGMPEPGASTSDPCERVARAITYYHNHQELMHYPDYRKQRLPLTSSPMESTVKLINARVKGSENSDTSR